MQLRFLGTGAAFCLSDDNYQSNILLTSDSGKRLLIDCGSDARKSLNAVGLNYKDVDDIYISHLHADHVGGLEYMGFSRKFGHDNNLQRLFICEELRTKVWTNYLAGTMGMNEEDDPDAIRHYFKLQSVDKDKGFDWEGIHFDIVPTRHVVGDDYTVLSYGLLFTLGGQKIYLTTDTIFDPDRLLGVMMEADIIFHDCETIENPTGVHPNYRDMVTLPDDIKAKTWLYHYDDTELPDATKDGFKGFVACGQVYEF